MRGSEYTAIGQAAGRGSERLNAGIHFCELIFWMLRLISLGLDMFFVVPARCRPRVLRALWGEPLGWGLDS